MRDQSNLFSTVPNTFTINVSAVNDAPTTSPVTLLAMPEDGGARLITQAELLVNAVDVDGPALSALNLTISAGNGRLIDNGNGTWSYTPALNDDTGVVFNYLVSDGSLTALGTATLDITPVNDAPVITSNGGGLTATVVIAENQSLVTTVTASDVDLPAQALSYSISGGADAARFTINAATGVLSFVVPPNFEAPSDADANNVYDVRVVVSDGLLSASQAIKVTVVNVNEAPNGADASLSTAEDLAYVLRATDFGFTDVDAGDALSAVRINTTPLAGSLTLNGAVLNAGSLVSAAQLGAGELVFTPAANASGNAYASFSFSVRDQSNAFAAVANTITINVNAVNQAPVFSGLLTNYALPENTLAITTVRATDVDTPSASLVYSISGGADAARFAIDAVTGALNFKVAPDFEMQDASNRDANGDGIFELTVQVSDGLAVTQQALRIAVLDVNEAPIAAVVPAAALSDMAAPGTWVTTASAIDPDANDALSFALLNDANGSFAIDARSGRITLSDTAVLDVKTAASYDLVVRITDKAGLSLLQTLRVNLDAAPRAPLPPVAAVNGAALNAAQFSTASSLQAAPVALPSVSANSAVDELLKAKPAALKADANAAVNAAETADSVAAAGRKSGLGGANDASRLSTIARVRRFADAVDLTAPLTAATPSAQNAVLLALMQFDTAAPTLGAQLLSSADVFADARAVASANSLGLGLRRGEAVDAQSDTAAHASGAANRKATGLTLDQVFSPAHVASVSFSAGFIWWLTRGGGLLTSMLMGVPAWRHIDLLPVLARNFDDEDEDEPEGKDADKAADKGADKKKPDQPGAPPLPDWRANTSNAALQAGREAARAAAISADITVEGLFDPASASAQSTARSHSAQRNVHSTRQ